MATVLGSAAPPSLGERGVVAIDVLRQTLHPKEFKLAPPSFSTRTSFQVNVEYNLNYEVGDPNDLVDEQVPTDSGLVLWFLNRGVDSVFHMGLVEQGTQSQPYLKGLDVWPRSAGNVNFANGLFEQLNYNAPLALPYGGSGTNSAPDHFLVSLSPELERNFSKCRLYGGLIRCATSSNIKDFANINSNGRFSLGALSDTRDTAQVVQGSSWSAFSPTNLVSGSITGKEGIKSAVANDGVVTIVGPDVAPTFSSPNHQNNDALDAEFKAFTINARSQTTGLEMLVATNYGQYGQIASMWVSPWQTAVPTTIPAIHTDIITGPIDEMGVLDITLDLGRLFASQQNSPAFGNQCEVVVYFNSIFAAVGLNGRIIYNVDVDTHCRRFSDLLGNALLPNGTNPLGVPYGVDTWVVTNKPRMQVDKTTANAHEASFTRVGKYIGTFIQVVCRRCVRQDVAIENAAFAVIAFDPFILKVSARSVDTPGACGPVRVIRYESLNTKDTLRLDGMANVQCVPQTSLAPFTQSAASLNPEASDFNITPWLVLMYNSETRLKRNWYLEEYRDLIRDFPNLTSIEQISDWSKRDDRLRIAGRAAGLFGDIGSYLGGLGGSLFGQKALGSSIGDRVGSFLDSKVGTSGVNIGGLDTLGKRGGFLGEAMGQSAGRFAGNRRERQSASAASDPFY